MKRISKILMLILCFLLVGGRVYAASPSKTAKKYVELLKAGNFEDSYGYFSSDLKQQVSKSQHVEAMKLVQAEFGEVKKVKKCKLPIIGGLWLSENMFKKPRVSYWNYCFQCEKGSYHLKIEITKYDKEYSVSGAFVTIEEDIYYEKFKDKMNKLGIKGEVDK